LEVYANSKVASGNPGTMCLTVDGRVHYDTVGAAPDGWFSQRCNETQEGTIPYNVVLSLPCSFLVRLLHFTDVLDNGFAPAVDARP